MAFVSCHDRVHNPNENITKDFFADMRIEAYRLNSRKVRHCIDSMMRADTLAFVSDRRVRRYYSARSPFVWITRGGVLPRADSALACLRQAYYCGLDTGNLRVGQIAADIQRLRELDVTEGSDDINRIMARVEYNLTRSYLRYAAGQMFGFVNPDRLYNHLEICDSDTVTGHVSYTPLCDLRTRRPDSAFYATAFRKAFRDSVGSFISSVQPRGRLYKALTKRLNGTTLSAEERVRTLCNIERCRWRQRDFKDFQSYERYVVVNVPSFSLRAVKGSEELQMRVGVGATDHKTPLLTSYISRMDINPQWIIPKSIAKGIVGRTSYMHSEGMFIVDRKRGKLPPEAASYTKVMDAEQFVVQAGGPKNPLGRIIFRFKNNFAVFLHDTSSPWIFRRNRRDVSHGCVRLEKPLELSLFFLDSGDQTLTDKITYSMTMPFVNDKDSVEKRGLDRERIVSTVEVKPRVPIFITYFTVFYGDSGELASFDDLYGYDEALAKELTPFIY